MPLIGSDDLVQIDLPADGEWVKVKRRLSRGDEIAVQQALIRGGQFVGSEISGVDAESAIEAAEFATLDVAIKAWSFDAPIEPRHIRALDSDSVAAIKARLGELYPAPRTDDDRKNSLEATAPLSAAVPSQNHSAG